MLKMKLLVTSRNQAPETVTIRLSTPAVDPRVEGENISFYCTVDMGSMLPVPLELYGDDPIMAAHMALIFCHRRLCSEHQSGTRLQWVNGPLFEPSVTFVPRVG
jgi:hypothetical protein